MLEQCHIHTRNNYRHASFSRSILCVLFLAFCTSFVSLVLRTTVLFNSFEDFDRDEDISFTLTLDNATTLITNDDHKTVENTIHGGVLSADADDADPDDADTSIKVVSTEIKEIKEIEEIEASEETAVEEGTSPAEEGTSHRQDNSKMNVLIFYPDDWRHDSIGSEKPYVLTPFLNQLAKEGIRFTHNAVTTSICWMSRATLWMGQYSSRHQSYKLKCPRMVLPENWKHSWVSILRNSGYHTGHIGKWQYWDSKTEQLFDWAQLFEGRHWYKRWDKEIDGSTLARMYAVDFLEQRPKDKPFTLSIAFYPPKAVNDDNDPPGGQWFPTNETKKLYDNVTIPEPEIKNSFKALPDFLQKRGTAAADRFNSRFRTSEHYQAAMKNYYALITGVDQACKEIVDKLKEEGLYNNTMIIFTTDNGMMHGAHGLAGKWYPFQESIRVPLIIYDPRMPKEKVGTLDDSFTLNIDLAETILGAAGIKPDELMQGRDISDLYLPNEKGEHHVTASVEVEPWREDFFYEFPSPDDNYIPSSTAVVTKEWKFINWPAYNREQLFNLEKDPLEMNDLYNDTSVKLTMNKLRERHDELKAQLHNTSYGPRDPSCEGFLDFLAEIQKAEERKN